MNGSREPAWCFPAATATTGAGEDDGVGGGGGWRQGSLAATGQRAAGQRENEELNENFTSVFLHTKTIGPGSWNQL